MTDQDQAAKPQLSCAELLQELHQNEVSGEAGPVTVVNSMEGGLFGRFMRWLARPAERFAAWVHRMWPSDEALWLDLAFNFGDRAAWDMGYDEWKAAGKPKRDLALSRRRRAATSRQGTGS